MNQYSAVTGQTMTYGANFNVSTLNGRSYKYDADKRLLSVTSGTTTVIACLYDGLGRCVKRTVNGVTTVFTYDEWNPVFEWSGTGAGQAWNMYGARADEILARWDAVKGSFVYKQDRIGNVTFLLNSAGAVVEKYKYDAFGVPTVTNADGSNPRDASLYSNRFMFTGREYLQPIASYDYRNRIYRPGLGRFLQVDPKGFEAGDMNLFRYCADDPVDLTDPMGLQVAENRDPRQAMIDDEAMKRSVVVNVTGSNIPVRIIPTNTGNWNDRDVGHHVASDKFMGEKDGKTVSHVTTDRLGASNIVVNHDLNWWVKDSAKNTDVVTREIRDHVNNWRDWWTNGDGRDAIRGFARSGFNGTLDQATQALRTKMGNEWQTQYNSQYFEYDYNPFGKRMPHDTKFFPPQPLTAQQMNSALSTLY